MTAEGRPALNLPRRGLGDRAFDLLIWGGVAVLLVSSFRAAEIFRDAELTGDAAA